MNNPEQFKTEWYHDTGEHAYKKRNLETYKSMVFRDSSHRWFKEKPTDMTPENPTQWSMRHEHKLEHYVPSKEGRNKDTNINYDWDWPEEQVFGGEKEFFSPNSKILDMGSGHGQVTREINEKFNDKGITCVGVDLRYKVDRPNPGTNLVGGNFQNLPFADKSFNRILSIESFPAWLPKDIKETERIIDEVARISTPGTIWRGTLPTLQDFEDKFPTPLEQMYQLFSKKGWEIVVDHGTNSFIAKFNEREAS